jgi:hypothetical protein
MEVIILYFIDYLSKSIEFEYIDIYKKIAYSNRCQNKNKI